MAFPEDDAFQQQEQHSSPKLFTEYSLSAILAFTGLIGSFMTIMMQSIVMIFVSWLVMLTSTLEPIFVITLICCMAMIPLGVYQLYHAYQLHKKSIHNFKRMQMIAGLNVILSIVQAAAYASIIFIIGLMMLYAFSGVILFNVIAVYFLNQSGVRQEFSE